MIWAAVIAAGVAGALLRYLTTRWLTPRTPSNGAENRKQSFAAAFPVPVLVVNVVGSAIGGAVVALAASSGLSADWRLILLTGFCGGLTTFSTWTVETVQLVLEGRAGVALASVTANLVLGVTAAAVAYAALT